LRFNVDVQLGKKTDNKPDPHDRHLRRVMRRFSNRLDSNAGRSLGKMDSIAESDCQKSCEHAATFISSPCYSSRIGTPTILECAPSPFWSLIGMHIIRI